MRAAREGHRACQRSATLQRRDEAAGRGECGNSPRTYSFGCRKKRRGAGPGFFLTKPGIIKESQRLSDAAARSWPGASGLTGMGGGPAGVAWASVSPHDSPPIARCASFFRFSHLYVPAVRRIGMTFPRHP